MPDPRNAATVLVRLCTVCDELEALPTRDACGPCALARASDDGEWAEVAALCEDYDLTPPEAVALHELDGWIAGSVAANQVALENDPSAEQALAPGASSASEPTASSRRAG